MRNPWVGLRPFSMTESDLFFGRDREIQVLVNLVATLPVLIVYAPSGREVIADQRRARPRIATRRRPAPDLRATSRRRTRRGARAASGNGWTPPADGDLAQMLEDHWQATEQRAVIVIDQFEERVNAGTPTDELYTTMARMVHRDTDGGCVVLCLREDYLGNLEPLMRRIPSLLNGTATGCRRWPAPRSRPPSMDPPNASAMSSRARSRSTLASSRNRWTTFERGRRPCRNRASSGSSPAISRSCGRRCGTNARQRAMRAGADLRRLRGARGRRPHPQGLHREDPRSIEPAYAQLFWAISRYLVLPTGAKAALTVEDLTALLQPSDFMDGDRTWLAKLPRERHEAMIRSVLAQLTRSDAPLFQRVVRSDREEFELLHDPARQDPARLASRLPGGGETGSRVRPQIDSGGS